MNTEIACWVLATSTLLFAVAWLITLWRQLHVDNVHMDNCRSLRDKMDNEYGQLRGLRQSLENLLARVGTGKGIGFKVRK